ncbi:F-box/WD repeat-containing protein 1A-like [Saccostrea echinata]|uniref:F-box/WD repeat-containing protein 1A-like n=1 Tax=Saccostrea echinata TaxID=191078 RepID=UPI002A7FF167|nr:F-box/WD repeat-containing protein 1A-like [Saccostrea echinata]
MTSVGSRKAPELNIPIPVFDDADAKPILFPRYGKKRSSEEGGQVSSERTSVPNWRGHGGRPPTFSSVEFDRQLDKISLWLESWDHTQRCHLLEWILRRSNHTQFQFLYTVMQPHLHRDFMYTAQSMYPSMEFKPFSTHTSRELEQKLILHRQNNFYRVKSGYFRSDDDVKNQAKERACVKFPEIPIEKETKLHRVYTEYSKQKNGIVRFGSLRDPKSRESLPIIKQPRVTERAKNKVNKHPLLAHNPEKLHSSHAVLRFLEMPVKRHIQNESNPNSLSNSLQSLTSVDQSALRPVKHVSLSILPEKCAKNLHAEDERPSELDENARTVINWYMNDWTDVKRNEFLHKVILKLDARQQYFISSFLSVRQHRDFLSLLPEKVALKILKYLSPFEILTCSSVSKNWYTLANKNEVWKDKCEHIEIKVPVPSNPNWKTVYRDNVYLAKNWESGACRVLDLKGHSDQVEEIIFDGRTLASGGQDKLIKLWDMKTGKLLQTLKGHDRGVWCLDFFTQALLVSGSYDGTIKVWNMKTGACCRTLIAHEGPVWAMVRHENILVSASQDRTAKVWDISRCHLLTELIGHNAAIFAVDMSEDGSLVITGSADRTVRIWDRDTGVKKQTIWASPSTSIMAVSYSKGLIACSYGETICLYNTDICKLIRTFEGHMKRIETVRLKVTDKEKLLGTIVSAGKDGLVKYWDLQRKESIQTKGQRGNVKCIYFDDLRIASGNGNRIRIFDFNFYDKSLVPREEVPPTQEGRRKSSVAAGTIVKDLNAESSGVKDGASSGIASPHPGEVYSRASRQSKKSEKESSIKARETPQQTEA